MDNMSERMRINEYACTCGFLKDYFAITSPWKWVQSSPHWHKLINDFTGTVNVFCISSCDYLSVCTVAHCLVSMRVARGETPSNSSNRAVTQEILCGLEVPSLPASDEGWRSVLGRRPWSLGSRLSSPCSLLPAASSWGIFLQLLIDFPRGASHFCTVISVQSEVAPALPNPLFRLT